MKYLLVSQFYDPNVGGAQRVVQELAENLAASGHRVEVITSFDPKRIFQEKNGVKVTSFRIKGNAVEGLVGEIEEFQKYLLTQNYDGLFIYAAQHWGLDAALPVLSQIKAKKIHVPCGYSALHNPCYKNYFEKMKSDLTLFDVLIYHSKSYRDYQFASDLGLENLKLVPNAASRKEFEKIPDKSFRKTIGQGSEQFILSTIGSPPYGKGHLDVLNVFSDDFFDHKYTLVLNGDYSIDNFSKLLKEAVKFFMGRSIFNIYVKVYWQKWIKRKNIILKNLPRNDVISLFFESDLFLFMSHIEYSPLVLFEAAAAGCPFLSVPCGNAEEIAEWTEGGSVLSKDDFASGLKKLIQNKDQLKKYSERGRANFLNTYNWSYVMKEYAHLIGANS